ncbi:hypothetical protein P4S73_05995 [Paraglaciecola sp. Hal342]
MIFAFFTAGMVVSRLVFALLLKWLTSHRLMLILATIMVTGCFMIKLAVDPVVMSRGISCWAWG